MAIPDYQSLVLPLLQFAADGREHTKREAVAALGQQLGLTQEEFGAMPGCRSSDPGAESNRGNAECRSG